MGYSSAGFLSSTTCRHVYMSTCIFAHCIFAHAKADCCCGIHSNMASRDVEALPGVRVPLSSFVVPNHVDGWNQHSSLSHAQKHPKPDLQTTSKRSFFAAAPAVQGRAAS